MPKSKRRASARGIHQVDAKMSLLDVATSRSPRKVKKDIDLEAHAVVHKDVSTREFVEILTGQRNAAGA